MKRLLPPLLLMVVLVALVLAFLGMRPAQLADDVVLRLRRLAPLGVLAAFGVYLLSYLGRAVRLAVLLPGTRSVPHLAAIAARHNLLNLVLPFRTGEVALPWMLKTEFGRPLAEGAAALLVARVLDLLCVAVFFALGIAWLGVRTETAAQATERMTLVLVVLAACLLLLRPVCRRVAGWAAARRGRLADFAARAAGHVAALPSGRLAAATSVSLLTWACTYGTLYLLVQAMAGDDPVGRLLGAVDVPTSLVGSTGLHLSTVLPVNTPAGVGVWEAAWIFGYDLLAGVDREAAGISAVVSHLAVFGFITVIGGLGHLLRRRPEDGARVSRPSNARPDG